MSVTNSIIPAAAAQEALTRIQADPLAASHWYSADQVAQRVQLVQQVYRSVMKRGTHYDKIAGCGDRDVLLKAGSEQILMTFRLAVQPTVEDLSTSDSARYRVSCLITHAPTGMFLGSGIGEASSDESKYKWRKAANPQEFEATPADRRRIKYAEGSRGSYEVKQVRMEVADVANTVLKMAKKRAQIDACLTVTAASDIFTQDLEDMEHPITGDEALSGDYDQRPQPVQMPQRKSAPVAAQPAPATIVAEPVTPLPDSCPDCGSPSTPKGCNYCGWAPLAQAPAPEQPLHPRSYAEPQRQPAPPQHAAPSGPVISEAQAKRLFAIAMGSGMTKQELNAYLLKQFGISKSTDMQKSDYEAACAHVGGK